MLLKVRTCDIVKLAVVTNYYPDRRPLSEYGFHLINGLREASTEGEVIAVAAKLRGAPSGEGVSRVWSYGKPLICLEILRALKSLKVDGVLFNACFTMWGSNLANFSGLLTPWVTARAGIPTITVLHHIPQTIDHTIVGYELGPLHRIAIKCICRLLAGSGTVCFPVERDRDYFDTHFHPARAVHVPHGLLGTPEWSLAPAGQQRILTFGNWGPSKDPESVIRAFLRHPMGTLVVAGQSSQSTPGFLERVRARYECSKVVFTGYVPEGQVAELFKSACLVVLPYKENTGISGVLHQACQYGRPVVVRRLPLFETFANKTRLKVFFYDTEEEMGRLLPKLLSRPDLLIETGRHNYEQVQHLAMDRIAGHYWQLLSDLKKA